MSKIKSWNYPEGNIYLIKFQELFESIEKLEKNVYINRWYSLGKGLFVYENDRFFYHTAQVKKNQLGYYIDDCILNRKGELKYNKSYGYFKEKNELLDFINTKIRND